MKYPPTGSRIESLALPGGTTVRDCGDIMKWDQDERSRSLRVDLGVISSLAPSSLSLHFPSATRTTMIFYLRAWDQATMYWALWNHESKQIFLPFSSLCEVFCHVVEKSNFSTFVPESRALLWPNLIMWFREFWIWFMGIIWKRLEKWARENIAGLFGSMRW